MEMNIYGVPPWAVPAPAAAPGYPWVPGPHPWAVSPHPWARLPNAAALNVPLAAALLDVTALPAAAPLDATALPAAAAYRWAPAAYLGYRAAYPGYRAAYGPSPAVFAWPRPAALAWPPPGLPIGPEVRPMELAPPPVVAPDHARPGGPLLRLGEPDRWEDWRGVPDSATDAAPVPLSVGDRLLCFRKAPDGQVYVAELDPAGAWSPWTAVPGARTALRPAAAAPGLTVYLFFVAGDGTLQVAVRSGGAWRAPVAIAGQRTVSPPGALAMDGTVFAFVRGDGDLVHYSRLAPGAAAWSPWLAIPGLETDDQPIPVEYEGRLTVFIHGKDGQHWYSALVGPDRWAGWLRVPRRDLSYTPPGAAVWGGFLWLFAQFPDFTIWFIAAADGFDWRTWRTVPLARSRSAPAPVVHGGRLYLFIRNMDDTISYTIRRVLRGEVIPSPGAARA